MTKNVLKNEKNPVGSDDKRVYINNLTIAERFFAELNVKALFQSLGTEHVFTFIIIYLTGKHNTNMKTSVEWIKDVDQSHLQGGLELKDNEIVIPQDGLYFVYSQASFRVSCSSRDADEAASKPLVHLSHTVKRWSSSYGAGDDSSYQTILHSIRTACQKTSSSGSDAEGNWFSAVYMGAVFNLRRGDKLKTVMEEKMLEVLEDESGNTFFGVFAL